MQRKRRKIGEMECLESRRLLTAVADDFSNQPHQADTCWISEPSQPGTFEQPGDRDLFSFDASAGEIIGLDLSSFIKDEIDVELLDSELNVLASARGGNISHRFDTDARFFVSLTSQTRGSYRISAEPVAFPVEDNVVETEISRGSNDQYGFDADVSRHHFSMALTQGEGLQFDLTRETVDGDPALGVQYWDGSGLVWLVEDFSPSSVSFTAPVTGVYNFMVNGQIEDSALSGTFRITANTVPDDVGDSIEDAMTSVSLGGLVSGEIEVDDDVDVFTLDVVAGQRYQLSPQAVTSPAIEFQVLSSEGIEVHPPSANGGSWVATTTGQQYVSISGQRGTYNWVAQSIDDDHGDVVDESVQVVPLNGSITGQIDYQQDQDVFAIDVATPGALQLVPDAANAVQLQVTVAMSADAIVPDSTAGAALTWYAEEPGRYFVTAYADAEPPQPYSFTLESIADDHPNLPSSPGIETVEADQPFSGILETPNDVDLFAIQLEMGDAIGFSFNGPVPSVHLLDATGTELVSLTAFASGQHLIKVDAAGMVGDYQLQVAELSTVSDQHASAPVATSTVLTTNAAVNVTVPAEADIDVFAFDAVLGQELEFQINDNDATSPAVVQILTANGTTLTERITQDTVTWKATASERFYISVDNALDYALSMQLTGTDDHGDANNTATEMINGSSYPAVITANDVDVLVYHAAADEVIRINATVENGQTATSVSDAFGNEISANDGLYYAPVATSYYVRNQPSPSLDSAGGSLLLSVVSQGLDEPDSLSEERVAEQLQLDVASSGTVHYPGDQDYFVFAATEGVFYELNVSGDDSLQPRIYDADGNLVPFVAEAVWYAAESAMYAVALQNSSDAYDSVYSLQLQQYEPASLTVNQVVVWEDTSTLMRVTGTAGQQYRIAAVTSETKSDAFAFPVMDLLQNDAKAMIASNQEADLAFRMPASGEVVLALAQPLDSSYRHEVSLEELVEPEPALDWLSSGTQLYGNNTSPQSFAVDLQGGDSFTIEATHGGGNLASLAFELRDPNGQLVPCVTGSGYWQAPVTGRYSLHLLDEPETFFLSFQSADDDHRDVIAHRVSVVQRDTVIQANFELGAFDTDVFAIDALEGETFVVERVSGGYALAVSTRFGIPVDVSGDGSGQRRWTAPRAGRYYLSFATASAKPLSYEWSISLENPQ